MQVDHSPPSRLEISERVTGVFFLRIFVRMAGLVASQKNKYALLALFGLLGSFFALILSGVPKYFSTNSLDFST